MFIKKEEKKQIQEQLASLAEFREKQTLMIQALSEQNAELQKTNLAVIEQHERNENILIEAVGKITDLKKSTIVPYTEEQKKKAAYALNLCMVSISQIVDYDDLYVLDQEYDMVLNNLNLENMPKDEALLTILKQTLDTITYFRMQEGDKRFLEKEYQHSIKNAIYNSVPRNLNILTCGESPWAIAISAALSLTCQIGTGYMNYRRNKADYNLKHEKQKWQLQRSAMEQFNGLRRDLFDTAWRLADEYNFADELRLTERQIDLYNHILDDTDDYRKFERLEIIKDAFEAYPPFWFFIGDTAARIATNPATDRRLVGKFKAIAIQYFEKYISMSQSNLLREDTLLATCALEYWELLDIHKDREKIYELLELAQKNQGNENDIIELISVAYMKIGNYERASESLRRLINEGYNVGINVQLLSSLYVQEYLDNPGKERKEKIEELYQTLISRTNGRNVFRLPVNETDNWNDINAEFVLTQQTRIIENFNNMLDQLEKKYNIKYNKLLPLDIKKNREYVDAWYYDEPGSAASTTDRRYAELAKNIKKDDYFSIYCLMYKEETFSEKALAVLGEMSKCVSDYLSDIIGLDDAQYHIASSDGYFRVNLNDYLIDAVARHAFAFQYIDSAFESGDPKDRFMADLKEINFHVITEKYFEELIGRGENNIRKMNSINDLFDVESSIRALCTDQKIRLSSQMEVDADEEVKEMEIPLSAIYGEKAKDRIDDKNANINKKNEMIHIIKAYDKEIIINPDLAKIYVENRDIKEYINGSRLMRKLAQAKIVAIVDDLSKRDKDLILTLEGIYVIEKERWASSGEVFAYQDVQYNKTNCITLVRKKTTIHRFQYNSDGVNYGKLYKMFDEIANILK